MSDLHTIEVFAKIELDCENVNGSNVLDPPVPSPSIDIKEESIEEKDENLTLLGDREKKYIFMTEKLGSSERTAVNEVKSEISDSNAGTIREEKFKSSGNNEVKLTTDSNSKNPELRLNIDPKNAGLTFKRCPYTNYRNPCEIVVPLIGTYKMTPENISEEIPLDFLKARAADREEDKEMAKNYLTYEESRRRRLSRSLEEIEREVNERRSRDMDIAAMLMRLTMIILEEMKKEEPNQEKMEELFLRFFNIRPTPMSLVFASPFVHTMMYVRGSEEFPLNVRRMANECYYHVHCMFPLPEGCNFETVYSSEVKKYRPEELNSLDDVLLDYGDFSEPDSNESDSDDNNESDSDDNNESDSDNNNMDIRGH